MRAFWAALAVVWVVRLEASPTVYFMGDNEPLFEGLKGTFVEREIGTIEWTSYADKTCVAKLTPPGKFSFREPAPCVVWSNRDPLEVGASLFHLGMAGNALKGTGPWLVAPYMPYLRQTHAKEGESLGASFILKELSLYFFKLIVVDPHDLSKVRESSVGLGLDVRALLPDAFFAKDIQKQSWWDEKKALVVAPDHGAQGRAKELAQILGVQSLRLTKARTEDGLGVARLTVPENVGVEGRLCILRDDILDSGQTLCRAAAALKSRGADSVVAYVTHAIFSGESRQSIEDSALDLVVVTDSQALPNPPRKVRVLSLAPLLAGVMNPSTKA